ncbi:hypothetical protein Dda_0056 [Drechslerella dactyloides]|uniref:Uncharacterized protein n=1 Tax=Drechslerella dactyloides TaxID=74499 RepID=A0AAD6NMD5_DREDA|nr:hypothetical protein Dda_0056 [Drechslerella dactyloides]
MESVQHLEETLAERRRTGKHLRHHKSSERLDIEEVWKTNLLEGRNPYNYNVIEYSVDVEYTKHWRNIYDVFRRQKVIPSRIILQILVSKAQDRMDDLSDALEAVSDEEFHPSVELSAPQQLAIDTKRWKFKYYEQTLRDATSFLKIHDERDLYVQSKDGPPFFQDD